jgi:ketosteroid isomerase-like protein
MLQREPTGCSVAGRRFRRDEVGNCLKLGRELDEIADRFAQAISQQDIRALELLIADDASIWHNTDGKAQGKEEAVAAIAAFFSSASECRYLAIRRLPTPSGFVQQHVLHVRFGAEGVALTIPACLIVEVKNRRISRLEEYLDSAAFSSVA